MALKLYVKLQNPVIELPIKAVDGAGVKDSFTVGFKRYPFDEAKDKLDALRSIYENYVGDEDNVGKLIDSFMKDEILYVKGIKVDTLNEETGQVKELHVPDTRTAKPVETLWESPEECLDVLLDSLLDCAPIRVSLNKALTVALLNTDYEEDKLKN